MKILAKNILIKIPEKKETFDNDPTRVFGKVVGIGENVEIDIAIGDNIYFHPSSLVLIPDEDWDVISEASVICQKKEVKGETNDN